MRVHSWGTVVVLISLGSTAAAQAADMAVKATAPPLPVAASSWTGFYVGGNVGGGWSNTTFAGVPDPGDHFLLPDSTFSAGNNSGGLVGGVQGGLNWHGTSSFSVLKERTRGPMSGAAPGCCQAPHLPARTSS